MANKDTKTMRGNWGKVWVNGELLASLEAFDSKVTAQYEEEDVMGKPGKYRRLLGYTVTGNIRVKKVNDRVAKLLAKNWNDFVEPEISILAENSDPDVGTTRVRFSDVTFDDFSPLTFENKALGKEEIAFAAGSYQMIDTIN